MADKIDIIRKYEGIVQEIYDDQTAGAFTFFGVLASLVNELELPPVSFSLPAHKRTTLIKLISSALSQQNTADYYDLPSKAPSAEKLADSIIALIEIVPNS